MPYYRGSIVTDDYLQALLLAYRQAYVNAGGPNYENGDQVLLDRFAASGIVDTNGAASAGREQAAADIAAGQNVNTMSLTAGGAIPSTPPPIISAATSGGDATAFLTLSGLPLSAGSATPNPEGAAFVATGAGSPYSAGASALGGASGGLNIMTLLLIAAVGFGAWYLMKGK